MRDYPGLLADGGTGQVHVPVSVACTGHCAALGGKAADAINPGPVDTGWMNDGTRQSVLAQTPPGRLGIPQGTARLVGFLCSPEGGWINGQLLMSNGGLG